jgi:hypothetical protein
MVISGNNVQFLEAHCVFSFISLHSVPHRVFALHIGLPTNTFEKENDSVTQEIETGE